MSNTTIQVVPVDSVPKSSAGRPRKGMYDDLIAACNATPGQWFSVSGLSRNQAQYAVLTLRKAGFLAKQRQNIEDGTLTIYAQREA
jgi:hypothetical protein